MRYHSYGVEDFVNDSFFQQWVLAPDGETDEFWRGWLNKNPDKEFVVGEARRIICIVGFSTDTEANARLLRTWKFLDDAWMCESSAHTPHACPSYARLLKVAAAITILMVSALTLWHLLNRRITVHTRFSEIKSIDLSDGSVVHLNANSSIEYLRNWDDRSNREVWLEGEAFFSVAHDPNKSFIVHTGEGIHVNVLGTSFNVMTRRNTTRVSLNTGKINVRLDREFLKGDKEISQGGFIMLPGEVAEFDTNSRKISRHSAAVDRYASWKEKKMVFDNTTMKEVAVILQDTYGLKVVLDKRLETRRITGEFKTDDLDILLEFIARALHARVTRHSDEIHFKT